MQMIGTGLYSLVIVYGLEMVNIGEIVKRKIMFCDVLIKVYNIASLIGYIHYLQFDKRIYLLFKHSFLLF